MGPGASIWLIFVLCAVVKLASGHYAEDTVINELDMPGEFIHEHRSPTTQKQAIARNGTTTDPRGGVAISSKPISADLLISGRQWVNWRLLVHRVSTG